MKNKINIKLILILMLGLFLRIYRLNSYPALNADEAAIGYNAYSLIETGKDEHGNSWPIHFQSFNDYKPGLYFYIVLPFVKYFGLNEWSVRLPSALLGVATIYVVYLLCEHLFSKKFKVSIFNIQFSVGEVAALFLAISPWHIHFSRGGWEVNVATFFIALGLLLLLKGFKNIVPLFLSSIVFSLSLYTYHSARVIVPLLLLGIIIIYWNKVKCNIVNFLLVGFLGIVTLLPLAKDFAKPEIISRAAGVGLFADSGPIERANEQRVEHVNFTGLPSIVLHNKAVNYSLAFLKNWLSHYHGEFLFLSGDEIQRNKVPETGQLYLFDIFFIGVGLIGIVRLVHFKKHNFEKRGWFFILWWLAIVPVAAALTFQSPHSLRSQNMVIPLVIISAFGLTRLISWFKANIKNKYLFFIFYVLFFIFILWQFARYEHMYWIHMAKEYPYSSQYGVKEIVNYVKSVEINYNKVIITDRYDQPYILFLFYKQYPPELFQKSHKISSRDKYRFSTVNNFDKYIFKKIEYKEDIMNYPNSLIIGTKDDIPNDVDYLIDIFGSNNNLYFRVVKTESVSFW